MLPRLSASELLLRRSVVSWNDVGAQHSSKIAAEAAREVKDLGLDEEFQGRGLECTFVGQKPPILRSSLATPLTST